MNTEAILPELHGQIIDLISECVNVVNSRQPIGVDDLLKEAPVAKVLNVAPGTLNIWRHEGKGPRYVKLGGAVRYRYGDLLDYIKQRSVKAGV